MRRILLAVLICLTPALGAAQAVPQSRAEITLSFAPVVKRAAPAVVNIYTRTVRQRRGVRFRGDPFFERFFGDFFGQGQPGRRRIENSLGSGVIVSADGLVVSNFHVVGEADEITVVLADRREFEAEVIFTDEASDLAVLQLDDAADLPVLPFRDSDSLEVGDLVLAIGNPFGVGQTVTSGIVSGLARGGSGGRQRAQERSDSGAGYFIQTDAAINPGNSGGALVDMTGALIGVNTAILTRSGGSNGIGFAVPANLVARVVEAARSGDMRLARPWLGVEARPVDGELADALGLDRPEGVFLEGLHPESPLAAAGLARGDLVLALGGAPVDSPAELAFRSATLGIGGTAPVDYLRRGEALSAEVALSPPPERPARDPRQLSNVGRLSGLSVISINPAVMVEARLPSEAAGVLVTDIAGPARRSALRRGDVIFSVNGAAVATTADLDGAVRARVVELGVLREGQRGTVRIVNG
ncbi:MAG: trypsin-like peptidase domain-containing protein [Pseudomonadota bacterium]